MAAQVEAERAAAVFCEGAGGSAPGVAGLAAAVQEEDRRRVDAAVYVRAQTQSVGSGEFQGLGVHETQGQVRPRV
jgi:ribonuclease HI